MMKKYNGKILIIDDNQELLVAMRLLLKEYFTEVTTLSSPNTLPSILRNNQYDAIMLDMNFTAGVNTGNEGIYWLKRIKEIDPEAVVILITAYGDVGLAVNAMKEGATDFILKPWDDDKLVATLRTACRLRNSTREINRLNKQKQHLNENIDRHYGHVLGESMAMKKLFSTIDKVAGTDANILITGENGTGKELIAREIHRRSKRNTEIFVGVDMGSLSDSLFESELFGHQKGAFTDAKQDRTGRFELANEGTLFLDEIGNLPLALQSKLLSAIQTRTIIPLGSNAPVSFNIRLICATNKPLYRMVEEGNFREDLLYRINTIHIELPPLRQRTGDIPLLANHFFSQYTQKYHKTLTCITDEAMLKLAGYGWPGNIRQLEHAIEKAVILTDNEQLQPTDFLLQESGELLPGSLNLEENECIIIKKALNKHNHNISAAVRELGISRKTLYNKMKRYEL